MREKSENSLKKGRKMSGKLCTFSYCRSFRYENNERNNTTRRAIHFQSCFNLTSFQINFLFLPEKKKVKLKEKTFCRFSREKSKLNFSIIAADRVSFFSTKTTFKLLLLCCWWNKIVSMNNEFSSNLPNKKNRPVFLSWRRI